jgi:hypothetical protein
MSSESVLRYVETFVRAVLHDLLLAVWLASFTVMTLDVRMFGFTNAAIRQILEIVFLRVIKVR